MILPRGTRVALVAGTAVLLLASGATTASAYHRGPTTYNGIVSPAPQGGMQRGTITFTVSADRRQVTSLRVGGTGNPGVYNPQTDTMCGFDMPALLAPVTIVGELKEHRFFGAAGVNSQPAYNSEHRVSVSGQFESGGFITGEVIAGDQKCRGGLIPTTPTALFRAKTTLHGKGTPECKWFKKRLKREGPKLRRKAKSGIRGVSTNAQRELLELRADTKFACKAFPNRPADPDDDDFDGVPDIEYVGSSWARSG